MAPSGGGGGEDAWRPDLYVLARFLQRLWRPDVTLTRSALQRAVGLNYDLFRKYLAFLESRGLVSVVKDAEGRDVVRLTKEGLRLHDDLTRWLTSLFGGSDL